MSDWSSDVCSSELQHARTIVLLFCVIDALDTDVDFAFFHRCVPVSVVRAGYASGWAVGARADAAMSRPTCFANVMRPGPSVVADPPLFYTSGYPMVHRRQIGRAHV